MTKNVSPSVWIDTLIRGIWLPKMSVWSRESSRLEMLMRLCITSKNAMQLNKNAIFCRRLSQARNFDDEVEKKLNGSQRSEHSKENELPSESGEQEVGGRDGPDPTRYGDWERNGLAVDF